MTGVQQGKTRSAVVVSLAVAALAGIAVAALALAGLLAPAGGGVQENAAALVLVGVLAAAALLALWYAHGRLIEHFQALEKLRGTVVMLAGNDRAALPRNEQADGGREVEHLGVALVELAARYAGERAAPDQRLQAVLASIPEAMVVITEQGQVSLVNYPAKARLGAERVRVGTSVFAALRRETVIAALTQAADAKSPVDCVLTTVAGEGLAARVVALGKHDGAVLTFAAEAAEHRAEVDCDLRLHDLPPAPPTLAEDLPLASLPVVVLDCETTGLDVTRDRIVSIGAVRLHGTRVYRGCSFDRLVNPGRPIPPRSTAIHGITDAMVSDAASFAEVYAELRPMLEGSVLVGHNIAFDIAMLRGACEQAGIAWEKPTSLDTVMLAAVLDPGLTSLSLEALAAEFGVDLRGRHTALGDALVTAELYSRLLPRLDDRGVRTLGQAVSFAKRAKHILKEQQRAGW